MKTSLMEFSGFLPVNTEANMELDSENLVAEEVEKERKAKDDEIIVSVTYRSKIIFTIYCLRKSND